MSRLFGFLTDLGYIRREMPFGESVRSSKKSLYKIDDPFLNFYFTFLVPNKSSLEFGLIDHVWNDIAGQYDKYLSSLWEEICRRAIPFMVFEGKRFNPAARWWGNGLDGNPMEVDVLAESNDKSALLLGEIKWQAKISVAALQRKLEQTSKNLPFGRNRKIIKAMFLKKPVNHAAGKTTHIMSPEQVIRSAAS